MNTHRFNHVEAVEKRSVGRGTPSIEKQCCPSRAPLGFGFVGGVFTTECFVGDDLRNDHHGSEGRLVQVCGGMGGSNSEAARLKDLHGGDSDK